MLSRHLRRIGMSTRGGTTGGNVVSPLNNNNAAANDAPSPGSNNANNAIAGEAETEHPVAEDNDDELSVESLTAAAQNPDAAAEARRRVLANFGAQAAAAAAAQLRPAQNNDGNEDAEFEDNCVITLEPPADPVTFDNDIQVYSRAALVCWMQRNGRGNFCTHPLTRVNYPIEEFVEMMRDVTGERRQRILAERERLRLQEDDQNGGRNMNPNLAEFESSSDEESSDDELLRSPPHRRRRTENGRINVDQEQEPEEEEEEETVQEAPAERVQEAPAQASRNRPYLGEFLLDGNTMRSEAHTSAFIALIQTAAASDDGLLGTLGHRRRGAFFQRQTRAFFSSTGPLARFRPISWQGLQGKVGTVITAARAHYNRHHSNAAGPRLEDIPRWATILFPLFDGNSQRDANRREHHAVVRGVMGAQAPLGDHQDNTNVHQLRDETSRNHGAAELRQRSVGNVNVERVRVEGRDDSATRRRPPRNNTSRVRYRNVQFTDADTEYAGRRSRVINEGFGSLYMLSEGITQAMVQSPQRTVREILSDIRDLENDRRAAVQPAVLHDIDMALEILRSELRAIHDRTVVAPRDGAGEVNANDVNEN